jgi:hypothetical protein
LLALFTAGTLQATGTAPPDPDRNLGFLTPVDLLPATSELQVLTADGRVLRGVARNTWSPLRGVSSFTLLQPDGERLRLHAEEIVRVSAPVDDLALVEMIDAATTTIEKASNTDWKQIEDVNELIFDSVAWPRPGNHVLLLRLNPGFDHNFRVYALKTSREPAFFLGGVPAFGDEIKAHIVVKGDRPPIKVKKGDYRKLFEPLYGDCPAMLAAYPRKRREFSDFANHIARYDRECGAAATTGKRQASR